MFVIEIRGLLQGYEELTPIGFWTRVGHAEHSWLMVSKFGVKLILKWLPENALSSWTCSSRVSSLEAKVFDKSMKSHSIVVPILRKFNEILAGFWYEIRMYENTEVSQVGHHQDITF